MNSSRAPTSAALKPPTLAASESPSSSSSSSSKPSHDPDETRRHFICGAGASFVNVIATFPMNKMMFRQQAEGHSVAEVTRHMKAEGMGLLYRGIWPPLLQKTISMSVMFGFYDYFYYRYCDFMHHGLAHVLASFTSGTCEAVLCPFERVQTLLQSRHWTEELVDTRHSFAYLRQHGVREYYRGASAVLLRNGPSTALFFGVREPLRALLPPGHSPLVHTINDFISGAVLGAAISTVFYPLNTVRIHMQSRVGGPHVSMWQALRDCVLERGGSVRALYRGVWLNASRALVGWGIINATYEMLRMVV